MDADKLHFFRTRYAGFDADALAELNERRESLAEEACAALDQILSEKGLSATMLSRFSATELPPIAPKRNWKLAGLQLVGALLVISLTNAFIHIVPMWVSLLIFLGFLSWWIVGKVRAQISKGRSDDAA